MAEVTMRATISGGFDGREYPPAGEVLVGISDDHAESLIRAGVAVESAAADTTAETATVKTKPARRAPKKESA